MNHLFLMNDKVGTKTAIYINKNFLVNQMKIQQMSQIHKRKEVIIYENSLVDECHSLNINKFNNYERIQQMKDIKDMNKNEMAEYITELLNDIQQLKNDSEVKDQLIAELQVRLESSSKDGRKSQVLDLLRKHQTISILEISKTLGISTKNVSSQLSYLRSDGYAIFTDPNGRKMLVENQESKDPEETE